MNSFTLSKVTTADNGTPSNLLNNVISDLKAKTDIEGAVLVNGMGQVIAPSPHRGNISALGLSELLPRLMELSAENTNKTRHIMFPNLFSEHNDRKILARYVNEDLFLLVLLQKSCYMGPAMLDMENSLLRIKDILNGHIPQEYQK